jgi:CRP/FNR family transcriptional regulator, cyclic AMP receptor protein
MKDRFEGIAGRPLLIDALMKQDVVQHDLALATSLADRGELVQFEPGAVIVAQDDADNAVYFLLSGESNALVNGRFVGARSDGTCIGEMAAIDPSARRSATVRPKSDVVALRVAEPAFRMAVEAHPVAYKALAQLLAGRLRERSRFVQPPNPEPVLFIGCSTEAVALANEIQLGLKHDPFEVVVWPNGIFGPSGTAFQSLENMARRSDFSAFVISPDDIVFSRGHEEPAPRDNVVFELGLFMGQLACERVFLIREQDTDVKIPSDLLGLTAVTYTSSPTRTIEAIIAPVCHDLRKTIVRLGVR